MTHTHALIVNDGDSAARVRFIPRTAPSVIRLELPGGYGSVLDRDDASALLEFLRDWISEQIGEPPYGADPTTPD